MTGLDNFPYLDDSQKKRFLDLMLSDGHLRPESSIAFIGTMLSDEATLLPAQGDRYRHWKGNVYIVVGLAIDTETDEIRVQYEREDPAARKPYPFSRTLRNFTETVERAGVPRFARITGAE